MERKITAEQKEMERKWEKRSAVETGLVNYILWNVDRVEQINLHSEKAVRAVGKISKAFNVEV